MCYERSCLCSWCRLAALPHCGSSELFHYCHFVPTQSNQRYLSVFPHVRLVRIALYLRDLQSSLCRSIQDHLTILTCVSRTTYDQRKHESIKFRYKVSYLLALLTSFRKRLDTNYATKRMLRSQIVVCTVPHVQFAFQRYTVNDFTLCQPFKTACVVLISRRFL
jgi:hypothetical protein